jgi:hypothetical protein
MAQDINYIDLSTPEQKQMAQEWVQARHPEWTHLSEEEFRQNYNAMARTFIDNDWQFGPDNPEQSFRNLDAAYSVNKLNGQIAEPSAETIHAADDAAENYFIQTGKLSDVNAYLQKKYAPERKPNILSEGVNR